MAKKQTIENDALTEEQLAEGDGLSPEEVADEQDAVLSEDEPETDSVNMDNGDSYNLEGAVAPETETVEEHEPDLYEAPTEDIDDQHDPTPTLESAIPSSSAG